VRVAAAVALATLALNSPGGVSSSASTGSAAPQIPGAVPLETTLALCVKGKLRTFFFHIPTFLLFIFIVYP
jgi:hypothetical protein